MNTAELILNKFLKNYENRFLFILYAHGWAGSLVSRIMRSSHQYYSLEDDPLRYPDNIEGFVYDTSNKLSFKKQHLACVHSFPVSYIAWEGFVEQTPVDIKADTIKYLSILNNTDYIINFLGHDFSLEGKYPKQKYIKVYGEVIRNKTFYTYDPIKKVEPSTNKLTHNLNINNLLSDDYNKFEDEYLKLTWSFDLDCKINSVRSFILLWKERQKRLEKF